MEKHPLINESLIARLKEGVEQSVLEGHMDNHAEGLYFDELVAANSLFRPGPMNQIPNYIKNKRNPSGIRYLDKRLEKYLKSTRISFVFNIIRYLIHRSGSK